MAVRYTLVVVMVFFGTAAFGQSQVDEIQRLQKLLAENEARALKAEKLCADQMKAAEAQVRKGRLLFLASELALASATVPDKELSALLAVQGYNYHKNNGGTSKSKRIYDGIFGALKRYGRSPMEFDKGSSHINELAGELCGLTTRNLTAEEWGIFVSSDLPYEKTCMH